jgi:carboxylesterase type B
MDAQETAVANTLQEYWGNFASTGDPNDATAVTWPPNDPSQDAL